jgi:hypothetical protein
MAMEGQLLADFDDFVEGGKEAEAQLARMKAAGDAAASALSPVSMSPAGLNQIKPAAKEAADATSLLTSYLSPLGAMVTGAFSVGAVVAFGKSIVALGGDIEQMRTKTGLTADEVQRLMHIAGQTNTPLSALTNTVQNLAKAFGENDPGLAAALKKVGLSFDDLKTGSTYDALLAISDALNQIEDPTERAARAAELLGKNWKELLPGVAAGMREVGEAATILSGTASKALDDFGSKVQRAYQEVKVLAGELLAAGIAEFTESVGTVAANVRTFTEATTENLPTVQALTAAASALPAPLKEITISSADLATEQRQLKEDLTVTNKVVEEATRAYAKWQEATDTLRTAGEGWRDVVLEINGSTVEAIKFYLDAGVAQRDLAAAYGLTATQIDAVVQARAEERAVNDAAFESVLAITDAIYDEAEALTAKVLAQQQADQATLIADKTTRAYYENLATEAQKAYAFAQAHADQYTQARLDQLRQEAQAAQETLATWQAAAEASLTSVKGAAEQAGAAIQTATEKVSRLTETANVAGGGILSQNMFPTLESLEAAARRPGSFIGLSKGNMTQSTIPWNTPWQQGAGGVMVNATFNYPIMDDPTALDQLAGIVGNAVMGRLSRSGLGG